MIDARDGFGVAAMSRSTHSDRALQMRIRSEYLEMPGMRLTTRQAARLFNVELMHCAQVLEALVTDGTLWTNGREFLGSNVGRRSL